MSGERMGRLQIFQGDNLAITSQWPSESINLIYLDPPFNTGKIQSRATMSAQVSANGSRVGFGGKRYSTRIREATAYEDRFEDFRSFIRPRLVEALRLLTPDGSLFLHMDYREIHYCKIMLDEIFGRSSFINEIVWAYDYGARSRKKWPAKHDTILWYARNPRKYTFNYEDMDRIPYMAPGLAGPEKAARGKTPTDVWWHTVVGTNSREKTGYATQKPLGILKRIVKVHSNFGDTLCDFFAGSGSFGHAAAVLGRHCLLVDQNPQAIAVMRKRFSDFPAQFHI